MSKRLACWGLSVVCVGGLVTSMAWACGASLREAEAGCHCAMPDGMPGRYPVFAKLGRGVSNALGGWLEIPATAHAWYSQRDTAGSLIGGTVHGVVRGIGRTAVGLFETATFLLPIPAGYAPIVPPLGYFQTAKRSSLPAE